MFTNHKFLSFTLLLILLAIMLILSINIGSVNVGFSDLFNNHEAQQIILQLRLPRAINALCAGALLALAGVIMQLLLKNPLADPYILGVSGGGSVMALLGVIAGFGGGWIIFGAYAGAIISVLLLFLIVGKQQHNFSFWLILSGVILSALWGAIIQFLLITSPDAQTKGMMFWLMGDLKTINIPWWALLVLAAALLLCLYVAREMNIMTRDSQTAKSLGVPVNSISWLLLITSAILTATAVSIAGNIGFIGLVVPHLARLGGATDHKILIPTAVLIGAILLITADLMARNLFAPYELPVGILTTLLGAPVFIFLIYQHVKNSQA